MSKLKVPIDEGDGPPILVLHGFAMKPATYSGLVKRLSRECRVIVPDLFAVKGVWSYEVVLDALTTTLDDLGVEELTIIGHSFGGGLELGFAARYPERTIELVFSDTLADSREWGLAEEAVRHPGRLLWLATPRATVAFVENWLAHPLQLVEAALWAFTSSRGDDSRMVARSGVQSHVLWANRDSILSRSDGMRFAAELQASFTVAAPTKQRVVDHDWMFQDPDLFVDHLRALGIKALG